ncbi:hypothetical protein BGZ83_009764 [Gryganskiella cystojenkinii]|nr:hypothetical protein BGZ83_009764 [Gryganskiella cystojenkinii]
MSSFILEATLDTKTPKVIELLGPASSQIQHQVAGTLTLVVTKPLQFKQLSVTFYGEASVTYNTTAVSVKSDATPVCNVDYQVIEVPTQYLPGTYSFPFVLSLPGDLAATDSTKLQGGSLAWHYELQTCGIPIGLFARRKTVRERIMLKRVQVEPSDNSDVRFSGKRAGQFECSFYGPKFVSCQDHKVHVRAFLHPYGPDYRVKEIVATAVQIEHINFHSKAAEESLNNLRRVMPKDQGDDLMAPTKYQRESTQALVKTDHTKPVSKTTTVLNPDQEEFSSSWGREHPVEFEVDLIPEDMMPDEDVGWLKLSHGVRITINFADPKIKSLTVVAPFQAGSVLEEVWSLQVNTTVTGAKPPDYGVDNDHSTLLDSNTSRITRSELFREAYPEREPLVPDLADDLPPIYEHDRDQPVPYSEK